MKQKVIGYLEVNEVMKEKQMEEEKSMILCHSYFSIGIFLHMFLDSFSTPFPALHFCFVPAWVQTCNDRKNWSCFIFYLQKCVEEIKVEGTSVLSWILSKIAVTKIDDQYTDLGESIKLSLWCQKSCFFFFKKKRKLILKLMNLTQ